MRRPPADVGEAAFLQQRIDRRQATAEGFVGFARVAQIAGAYRRSRAAVWLSPDRRGCRFPQRPRKHRHRALPTTCRSNSRPHSRRRRTDAENAAGGGASTISGRHARCVQGPCVRSRGDVEAAGIRQRMQVEVDERAGGVFDRREALIEGARREQPVEQCFRHRLAGAEMARVPLQDLRHLQPVLVELRGQFDEVARHRGAGEQRIRHVGQHPVQSVAELVEQRARVIEGEQRRLPRRRFGEIADVENDRTDVAAKASPGRATTSSRRRCAWSCARSSRR